MTEKDHDTELGIVVNGDDGEDESSSMIEKIANYVTE